jgi:dATP pyrophosphohydrolase
MYHPFSVHLLAWNGALVYNTCASCEELSMPRAPFQVLVFPYRQRPDNTYEFALFRRADDTAWQGIAGGGEDEEAPLQAAQREAFEEAGISPTAFYMALDTITSVPVTCFRDSYLWGDDLYVIPEYSFGVCLDTGKIVLSSEHTDTIWVSYAEAVHLVRYDSNRVALWELHQKVRGLGPRDPATGA